MNNDITFYIQGWEPEGTPKALICLVHGLGEHTGRYEHVGKALNEAGYALFGFDLRGNGQSGGPRGHFPSLDIVLSDIHQFIGLQKQNFPDTPIFLYGHSLGGLLVLAYAIKHENKLNGIVTTGAALHTALTEQRVKIALINMLWSLFPTLTLPSGLNPADISSDPDVVQRYKDDPLVHNKASLGFGKAGLNAIDLCFARARDVTVPLLNMHGTGDKLNYFDGTEEFSKLVSETNNDVTLKLWDGLHHELHNEPEQADVFIFMVEWLDKHL
ncbi:MAG TPA: lysophospholipase [Anaerolineales bacterium]|nr:lysophospholipase [Anaerolineales bacterium]